MIASVCALSLWACVNPQVGMRRTDGATTASQRVRASTGEEHRVQKGETLYAIAFRYAIDFRDLAAWNQIPEPFTIYPNQRLRLKNPVRTPQLEASAVRSGGTSSNSAPATAVTTSTTSTNSSVSTTTIAPVPTATVAPMSTPAIQAGTAVAAGDGVSVGAIAPPPTPARTESLSPTNAEGLPTGFTAPSSANTASTASSAISTPTLNNSMPAQMPQAAQQVPATASTSTTAAIAPTAAPTVAPSVSPTIAPTVAPSTAPKPIAGRGGWGWPAGGKTISTFAVADPKRQGIDVAGNAGDGVYAAKSGEVVYSGRGITGYGELIVIKHDDATLTAYGHNRSRLVKEGQNVTQGQQIAEMGKDATGRQLLHFEVRRNGKPIDPMTVLPAR
jgi:lipoprotein NlpD